jgi:hypothetical protein
MRDAISVDDDSGAEEDAPSAIAGTLEDHLKELRDGLKGDGFDVAVALKWCEENGADELSDIAEAKMERFGEGQVVRRVTFDGDSHATEALVFTRNSDRNYPAGRLRAILAAPKKNTTPSAYRPPAAAVPAPCPRWPMPVSTYA